MDYLIDEILEYLAELPLLSDSEDVEPKIMIRYYGKAAENEDGGFKAYCSSPAPWLKDVIKWAHLIGTEEGLSYSQFAENSDFQADVTVMLHHLKRLPIEEDDNESNVIIELRYFGHLEGFGRACSSSDEYESTWMRGVIQSLKSGTEGA